MSAIVKEKGRKFIPTKKNIPWNRYQTDVWLSKKRRTKEVYLEKYFGGLEKLQEDFKEIEGLIPVSLGDDTAIKITVRDPNKVFGMSYKTIKYFASNIYFDNILSTEYEKDDIDKVSFWFVQQTKTRWVEDIAVVEFYLQIDPWATFAHIYEQTKGLFLFKKMHQPRFVETNLKDKSGNETGNFVYVPNIKDNRGHLSCTDFCKQKNQKVISTMNNVLETYPQDMEFKTYAILYCTNPENKEGTWAYETEIRYGKTSLTIPYDLYFIEDPNKMHTGAITIEGKRTEHIKSRYEWAMTYLQSTEKTIINVEFSSFNKNTMNENTWALTNDINTAGDFIRVSNKFGTEIGSPSRYGGNVKVINKDTIDYSIYYKGIDELYNSLEILCGEEINYKNEPHIYMSNHTELRLVIPEKNPVITDFGLLYQNGNPILYDKTDDRVYIEAKWTQILDAENGGKMMYLSNTSSDFSASIYNSRSYNDFTGSNNFPYKTNAYLTELITKKNQKQASYDNINTTKETAEYVMKANMANNIVQTAASALSAGAGMVTLNPFKQAQGALNTASAVMSGVSTTVTQALIETEQYKAEEKKARATTDAQYADLANSPSNVQTTGKINSSTTLAKQMIANPDDTNITLYKVKWFRNQVNDFDLQQIAYDLNRYGYVCDTYIQINDFKDLLTRVYWNYVEIVNIKDYMKGLPYDWNIIEYLSGIFKSGITIHNADNVYQDEFVIDFTRNNFEESLLENFGFDYIFDCFVV